MSVWSWIICVAGCHQRFRRPLREGPLAHLLALMWLGREGCCTPKSSHAPGSFLCFRKREPIRSTDTLGIDGTPCPRAMAPEALCLIKKKNQKGTWVCSWTLGPLCNFPEFSFSSVVTSLLQPVPETRFSDGCWLPGTASCSGVAGLLLERTVPLLQAAS